MFEARKTGNQSHADILNMVIAAIKNVEIDKGKLKEEQELEIVRKEAKKIQDSIEQFNEKGREDLAKKEEEQLEVLKGYLPVLMSEDKVEEVVAAKIKELGASSMQDMGKVMGAVMQELKGKADGTVVNNAVKKLLS